ncbi:hypothetical protein BGW36DRAFT_372585 [Talaromyces proteolyticus]|uniref:Ketoreductase domain-containing protein n=1 Tax=Talaromyces proteolyticus TaxID=1131652 RepID=A0AAD4PZ74_9EURO|nr:uncharacterized protein BGW36DRAFT_372585 [Talaromyces proteolyticus]KAH8702320.1 hypothetical protein BGW36DRAFT_372585 [Talaromyces proteolyticus]
MAASRVWLITGASSGIGLELAKVAASRGDRVIAATRSPQKIEALGLHANIKAARLDHNESLPHVKSAVEEIINIFGTVDMVVNNAAYVQTGMLEETSPEETLEQFQANVLGPLNVYRAILPHLREKRSGTLVTVGSMAAWYPMPGCNLYDASKAALRWLGIGLSGEISQFGIRHTLIEPGFFRTDLLNPSANFATTDASKRLPAYADSNAVTDSNFVNFHGKQLGNPVKGAEVLYDVITSSGIAAGKELPDFFPLGSDASTEISKAAAQTIATVDAWREISALSDFPSGQ